MKRLTILLFILMQLSLLSISLYVTRFGYTDLKNAVMEQLSSDIDHQTRKLIQHINGEHQEIWSIDIVQQHIITSTTIGRGSYIIANYDSSKEYPIIWSSITRNMMPYYDDSFVSISQNWGKKNLENKKIIDSIFSDISLGKESRPTDVTIIELDGITYLIKWYIVPAPFPNKNLFLLINIIDTQEIIYVLNEFKIKYTVIFIVGLFISILTLISIPYQLKEPYGSR
jgi:hypothetical protein